MIFLDSCRLARGLRAILLDLRTICEQDRDLYVGTTGRRNPLNDVSNTRSLSTRREQRASDGERHGRTAHSPKSFRNYELACRNNSVGVSVGVLFPVTSNLWQSIWDRASHQDRDFIAPCRISIHVAISPTDPVVLAVCALTAVDPNEIDHALTISEALEHISKVRVAVADDDRLCVLQH